MQQQVQQLKKAALDTVVAPSMYIQEIPLSAVGDNPYQKRKNYGDIRNLADSIALRGLQNPISVIRVDDRYVIVSGHRRVRAFRDLHRKSVPAIIRRQSTKEDLAIDIATENLQREDLQPVEKGETLLQLLYTLPSVRCDSSRALTIINQVKLYADRGDVGKDFVGKLGFLEEDLFKTINLLKLVGMTVNTASQYIRILQLPEEIQGAIVDGSDKHTNNIPDGKISVKMAYEITRIKDTGIQKELFEKATAERLKYINVKFLVDKIVENEPALANRNLNGGTAARRIEDDAGLGKLTDDCFKLSSTVWNFRAKLPLAAKRLDKLLWTAALNKMKKSCMELVHNINNLQRDDMTFDGWLEEVNADLEVTIRPGNDHDGRFRFSIPYDKAAVLDVNPGDKLLLKIEGVVRAAPGGEKIGQEFMDDAARATA